MTTTTTIRTTAGSGSTPTTARAVAVLDHDLRCGCGQELDCCAGEHCPRCGHELRPSS